MAHHSIAKPSLSGFLCLVIVSNMAEKSKGKNDQRHDYGDLPREIDLVLLKRNTR